MFLLNKNPKTKNVTKMNPSSGMKNFRFYSFVFFRFFYVCGLSLVYLLCYLCICVSKKKNVQNSPICFCAILKKKQAKHTHTHTHTHTQGHQNIRFHKKNVEIQKNKKITKKKTHTQKKTQSET